MCLLHLFKHLAIGKCQASGDPHYYPWDGGKIDYQGLCEHLLAGTCPEMPGDLPKWAVRLDKLKTKIYQCNKRNEMISNYNPCVYM